MLETIVLVCLGVILAILFWPRRSSPYVRRVTKSYNGQHYGKERELY